MNLERRNELSVPQEGRELHETSVVGYPVVSNIPIEQSIRTEEQILAELQAIPQQPKEEAPKLDRTPTDENPFLQTLKTKQERRRKTLTPKVVFDTPEVTPITWRDQLANLQEQQIKVRQAERGQEYAKIKIDSKLPIGIMFTSDWHIGSSGTDYQAWEKTMEMVKNEPNLYMVLLSNTIDNFIFPSGMFAQMIHPSQQMDFIRDWAKEFGPKILGIVGSRCHEGWTQDKADVDIQRQIMFRDNIESGTPWLPASGVLEVDLNGIEYTAAVTHKARFQSALNPTNPNRQMHDLRYPTDIVAIAHNHVKMTAHQMKYEGPYQKDVVYLRTGAFKIQDGYGQLEGFGQGQLGSPVVWLDSRKKNMETYFDAENAAEVLRITRELDLLRKPNKGQ